MLTDSLLQKLEFRHRGSKRPLNLGVYYKNTLIALCHALEDFILDSSTAPLMIAAFQRGKWYLQEAERYGEIAQKAAEIVIMATDDAGFTSHPTSQQENVHLVSLALDDPVAQEWHLIIFSPTYTAMVLCQELSEADYGINNLPKTDLERKFYGFWTFEPELVKETVELAIAHINPYNSELAAKLTAEIAQMSENFANSQKDDLGAVVSRVVNYLQNSQQQLLHPQNTAFSQALDDNLVSNEMQAFLRMAQLIDQADALNPMAATKVAALVEAMGQLLDLPAWQIKRLRLAALLHRLAPLQAVSQTQELKTTIQKEAVNKQEILPKASVLRIMPQLQAITNIIIHQTEYWEGTGKPEGLAYDNIPLESRILGLITTFQQQLTKYQNQTKNENPLLQALNYCQQQAGKIFDPKLVEALELLVLALQQGMSFPTIQPKIASGIWLLELSDDQAKINL